jgi:hypothetical protein
MQVLQVQLNELRKKWDFSISEMDEEKQSLSERVQLIRPSANEYLLIVCTKLLYINLKSTDCFYLFIAKRKEIYSR